MEFIEDITTINPYNSIVTIGKFDGFHLGHMRLFETAVQKKDAGKEVIIFMLDAKPAQISGGAYAGDILSLFEKKHFSYPSGIDKVLLFHFDKTAMSMSPEEFVENILVNRLNVKEVVVGFDFGFGKRRAGNVNLLKDLGVKYDFSVTAVPEVSYKGDKISSTRIKEELCRHNLADVNNMLGRPYSVTGRVIQGEKIGRKMGFPTINMEIASEKLSPPSGGYATKVCIDGKQYSGMSNIGTRPTVQGSGEINLETHILDFEGDLYGRTLTVEFFGYIRPEEKFADISMLKEELKKTELYVRNFFRG